MESCLIERNETTVRFVLNKIERGTKKGTQYLCVSEDTPDDERMKFLGMKECRDIIWQALKTICLGVHRQATDGEGIFSLELFKKGILELEERTESREKLRERKDGLVSQLQELTNKEFNPELLTQMKTISNQINALNILIARRAREIG